MLQDNPHPMPAPSRRLARLRHGAAVGLLLVSTAVAGHAQPTVVPTAEGQVGEPPMFVSRIFGARFLPISSTGLEWLISRRDVIDIPGTNSNVDVFTDTVHQPVDDETATTARPMPWLEGTGQKMGDSDDSDTETSGGDSDSGGDDEETSVPLGPVPGFRVLTHHQEGATPGTVRYQVDVFDRDGMPLSTYTTGDIPTILSIIGLRESDVTVDRSGRVTLVYARFDAILPELQMERFDGMTGQAIGGVTSLGPGFDPEVDILQRDGNRVFVAYSQSPAVVGLIVDVTSATPLVGVPFQIDTTTALAIERPVLATDSDTGAVAVAWDSLIDNPGDPVNLRMRRFDATGTPLGNDFVVHTTTANAQAQGSLDFGPNSELVVAFTSDTATVDDALDVFVRVYDATGAPIGTELRVPTTTADIQDRPSVRFLPEPDAQGRPQFAVLWRDVGSANGANPRGSGLSYRCFSIDGLATSDLPFADGFESGDTSSWSQTVP